MATEFTVNETMALMQTRPKRGYCEREQEALNRKVLARVSDMCEQQFSSLGANKDRIGNYLQETMAI